MGTKPTKAIQKSDGGVMDYPIVKSGAQALDILRENLGLRKLSEFDLNKVTVPSGGGVHWEVSTLAGVEAEKAISGIIVFFKDMRRFYAHGLDDDDAEKGPPDCYSINLDDGIKATEDGPGGKCEQCPMNEWGSALNGGKGKACKEGRLLFMIMRDSLLPRVIQVPATSLKSTMSYFLGLTCFHWHCITSISLTTTEYGTNKVSELVYEELHLLNEDERAKIDKIRADIAPALGQKVPDIVKND